MLHVQTVKLLAQVGVAGVMVVVVVVTAIPRFIVLEEQPISTLKLAERNPAVQSAVHGLEFVVQMFVHHQIAKERFEFRLREEPFLALVRGFVRLLDYWIGVGDMGRRFEPNDENRESVGESIWVSQATCQTQRIMNTLLVFSQRWPLFKDSYIPYQTPFPFHFHPKYPVALPRRKAYMEKGDMKTTTTTTTNPATQHTSHPWNRDRTDQRDSVVVPA